MTRKAELVLIAASVLILGLLAYLASTGRFSRTGPVNRVVEIPESSLPQGFPSDVPIEAGAKILKNYTATSPSGRVQATREFESSRSVGENFSLYRSFLSQSGWKLLYELDDARSPSYKAVFGRNAAGVLNVSIRAGAAPDTSIVDVSFLPSGS
ncbi:hypothetical protein C4587_00515 [Candidatus Parcubacteria bacterium]|nr:MAG: hypothetical protein C4587_00515 [Candidatus Parcubacteria bacterium]